MNIISDREKNLEEELTKIQLSESDLRGKIKLASIAAIVFASILLAWMITSFQSDVAQAEKRCAKNVETIARQRGESEVSAQAASAAIQRRDVDNAKHTDRSTVSEGYPMRSKRPLNPFDHKFVSSSLTWLNSLPFGTSKASIENALPYLTCDTGGHFCTSGFGKNLNLQCLVGIDRICDSISFYFSNDDYLESIYVTYDIVKPQYDPVIFFAGFLDQELGLPVRTETSDSGVRARHDSWKIGRHKIVFNSHMYENNGRGAFLSLVFTQKLNF